MGFLEPPIYSESELKQSAQLAIEDFRIQRTNDEIALATYYSRAFHKAFADVQYVFNATDNLTRLAKGLQMLLTDGYLGILRYLCRPTVSDDDFTNLSGVATRARSSLGSNENVQRTAGFLNRNLNEDLFPWLVSGQAVSEPDLLAAKRAVAALIAEQQTKTAMRGKASKAQEKEVRTIIQERCGYKVIPSRSFNIIREAPNPGELFDRETTVAGTKADVVLGLRDGRFMALECKVSNTEVNSFKRLNHEVVEKVVKWTNAFGKNGVVAGAVLQGCFKVTDLARAQDDGAALFWSRDLEPLVDFINSIR